MASELILLPVIISDTPSSDAEYIPPHPTSSGVNSIIELSLSPLAISAIAILTLS